MERTGNALKVSGAKKMFANLMVIPAREIQTVLSINYVLMEIVSPIVIRPLVSDRWYSATEYLARIIINIVTCKFIQYQDPIIS